MQIPAAKIYFPKSDISDISCIVGKILKSGKLTLGKYTKEFEEKFANYIGVKHAIAVNSGTSALEILLRIFNITGKEVIVPTNTFFATAAAVIHAGGKVRFIDVDPCTFSIRSKDLIRAINKNTKGVIIVHVGGMVTPEIKKIKKICKRHGLFLLEDAAHAHGSTYNNLKAGSFGDAAGFSFYPTKVITSTEGGMIATNHQKIDKEARIYRDQGKIDYSSNYHVRLGHNWRMSEIHAYIGLKQLKRIEEFISTRRKIAFYYDRNIDSIKYLKRLNLPPNLKCNYYKYIVMLHPNINRQELKKVLKDKYQISLSGEVYDTPCHQQPVFLNNYKGGPFPSAENICKRHICLPISASMTIKEAEFVLHSLDKTLKFLSKK